MPELRWSVPASRGSLSVHGVRTRQSIKLLRFDENSSATGTADTLGTGTLSWVCCAAASIHPVPGAARTSLAPIMTTKMAPDGQWGGSALNGNRWVRPVLPNEAAIRRGK